MYNLFVAGKEISWEGEPFIIELSRCVREYTDKEITEKYSDLKEDKIELIKKFPCIFSYEEQFKKNPKFGLISDITVRKGKVKIDYELIELECFITHLDIPNMLFELDISDWEMNRTHWAIKNVNLEKELYDKDITLPSWTRRVTKSVDITKHRFDVSLSFPGEIRNFIKPIVANLEREIGPDSYFYDENYKAQLARPALDELLQDIYRERSKLVVVFLCEKYQEKEWCGIEFRAIKEIIMERDHQKIMFIKMDDGDVKGVFKTDGYINGRTHTPKDVATYIKERIDLLP